MNKNKSILIEGTLYESDPFTPCNENNDGDENDGKSRKRTLKVHQSKNLEAERKRRKKLNDRLYSLRALVPNISKLDRAAILGDAINYVKELQKQVKNLQIELEEQDSDRDENNDVIIVPGTKRGPKIGDETFVNTFRQNQEVERTSDKVQQMEPQVEVFEMDGNEFFVKIFCEHKAGGFVRLMEALTSLGLKVINVNATRHTCLVSNIFRVEKRDNATIHANHVKESLLKLT